MQAIYRAVGETIAHTPNADVAAGSVVVRGDIVTIAKLDIAAGELGGVSTRGVFDAVKDNSDMADGSKVYWNATGNPVGGDAGTGAFSSSDGSGTRPFAGYALGAAGTGEGRFSLLLSSASRGPQGPQGEQGEPGGA